MSISIVVPVYNESGSIAVLLDEIAETAGRAPILEAVIVDDGSDDDTVAVLEAARKRHPFLRVVRHGRRSGQSTALRTGIACARGDVIVTLDGDGQNDPADIPSLYKAYLDKAVRTPRILVAGQRRKRHDTVMRRIASRLANGIRRMVLKDGVRDTGCSLKLFRRTDFMELPAFNHLHRYIPALMKAKGAEIVLVDVSHRPRVKGVSKYGIMDRAWAGLYDLFGVRWLVARTRPFMEITEL